MKIKFDSRTLTYIKSRAIDYMKDLNNDVGVPQGCESVYCYVMATISYLRSKGLLSQLPDFTPQLPTTCNHEFPGPLKPGKNKCKKCQKDYIVVILEHTKN